MPCYARHVVDATEHDRSCYRADHCTWTCTAYIRIPVTTNPKFPTKPIPTTNTLNKHTQQTHATCSFVLSHPPHRTHIHPNSFPPEPKCFRVLFAPATPPRQTFECGCSLVLASSSSCGKCLGVYASISPPVGPLIGLPSLHAFLLTPLRGLPPSLDPRGLFPALGPNRHAENIYLKLLIQRVRSCSEQLKQLQPSTSCNVIRIQESYVVSMVGRDRLCWFQHGTAATEHG